MLKKLLVEEYHTVSFRWKEFIIGKRFHEAEDGLAGLKQGGDFCE
jgi:hypothetical protein